jgi:hypothetical protein
MCFEELVLLKASTCESVEKLSWGIKSAHRIEMVIVELNECPPD